MGNSEQSQIEDLVESVQNKKNATRRNLDSLGTMGVMDLGDADIEFSDVILLFASFMGFLVLGNMVPDGRNWALFVLVVSCLMIGGVFLGIYVSPPQMSFYKWLKCKIGFKFGADYRSAHVADSGRITKDRISTNGDRRALEDLTRVDGFAPQADAVWRFDGALVGGVRIDPAELSLASTADWEAAADELGSVINSLEHSGQLRNGSVKIDTESVKRMFGDRLGDADVRGNPNLQQNVAMYKNKLPDQMDLKNASIRGFQILAPVTMEEVQMQGHRVLGRMNDIPVIGSRIASMLASRNLTIAEIRYRQERIMEERRTSLEKNLGGITGCDADQLSMDDVINVLEESWTGERVVSESRDDRSLPLVTMSREYTETQSGSRLPDQLADDELDQQILEELQTSVGTGTAEQGSTPGSRGATDFSDEVHDRRAVSDDDFDGTEPDESDPEPHPEAEREPEPQPPKPEVPDRSRSGTEGTADTKDEISVDDEEYDSIEEVAAALVEEMERSEQSEVETTDTDSGTDAETQKATT